MAGNVTGLKAVLDALRRTEKKRARGVQVGLKRMGLFIQRESQKIVPIDTTLLRTTANTRAEGKGFDTVVTVSYGTDYAIFVHEDMEAKHKPGKSAKFLEIPIRQKKREYLAIFNEAVAGG